jgi:hypothetical protein
MMVRALGKRGYSPLNHLIANAFIAGVIVSAKKA